jgi:hypothetical protein
MRAVLAPKVTLIPDQGRPWKNLPRCSAIVSEMTRRWRTFAGKDDQCERNARYMVEGQPYCKLHAGEILLEELTEKEKT